MSVCIAAFTHKEGAIVTASDRMVSTDFGQVTADATVFTLEYIAQGWFVLFAGNDIGCVPGIFQAATATLEAGGPRPTAQVGDVRKAIMDAYNTERAKKACEEALGVYGIQSLEELNESAREKYGDTQFLRMTKAVDSVLLDVDLLLCGYDDNGYPHLLSVETGIFADHDRVGYAAIGSGRRLAVTSLMFRRQSITTGLEQTIYNVCEAKFRSEAAAGVGGDQTFVTIHRADQAPVYVKGGEVALLRERFQEHESQTPPGAISTIAEWLEFGKFFERKSPGGAPLTKPQGE